MELSEIISKQRSKAKLRERLPVVKRDALRDSIATDLFIHGVDQTTQVKLNLKRITLDELAEAYHRYDGVTQLVRGMILIEGRDRFEVKVPGATKKTYDLKKYGAWIRDNDLDTGSTGARNNYMNLAAFFTKNDRRMDGIALSAAYEMARPKYSEVAPRVYNQVKNRNFPSNEVVRMLEEAYGNTARGQIARQKMLSTPQILLFSSRDEEEPDYSEEPDTSIIEGHTTLGSQMPEDVLRLFHAAKPVEKPETTENTPTDTLNNLKLRLTEEEKIEKVKKFIDTLSLGKMEAFKIAKAASDYFLKTRY